MKYQLDNVISRNETDSAKWEFYHLMNPKADKSCIPLWVADMDFPCSDEIIEALHERVDKRIFGYSNHAYGEFFRAVCGWFQHRFNWYINSKDIVVSFGVVPALGCLVQIMTEPGDNVLIQQPVYYPFMSMIGNNGRHILANQLVNDGNGYYSIDFEDFEAKAALPETKLFILCSPHNPVGRVWTKEELRRMTDICKKYDVKIVSDEIHCDLSRMGVEHYPLPVACPDYADNIIVCTAPSKSFNIAGLQSSFIIIKDEEVKKKWKAFMTKQLGMDMMAALAIPATKAAYVESEEWLDQVRAYIDENLFFMKNYLSKYAPRVKFRVPDATYLTWLDVRAYNVPSRDLWNELASDGKVLLESGPLFGEQGEGFIRMNVASPRSIIYESLRRFAYTINRQRPGTKVYDFECVTRKGRKIESTSYFKENKKTLLCFLRYAGCTVCQLDMQELSQMSEKLREKGIVPAAVLQSSTENASKLPDYDYDIICDPDADLYKKFSIMPAIEMDSLMTPGSVERIKAAKEAGFKHGAYEGNEKQRPALFVIDENGTTEYAAYFNDLDISPAFAEISERYLKGEE